MAGHNAESEASEMAGGVSTTDWAQRVGGLTIEPEGDWPSDQLGGGRMLVRRLVQVAAAQPACLRHPRAGLIDATVSCRYTPGRRTAETAELCRLVRALATLAEPRQPQLPGDDTPEALWAALRRAAGAVYFCRRTEHALDACWFADEGPDADRCGQVLSAAHRLTAG